MTKRAKSGSAAGGSGKAEAPEATWQNASEREREAIITAEKRLIARRERLRVRVEKTDTGFNTVAAKGGVEASLALQLADAMGTTSPYFTDATLSNIATVSESCNNKGVTSTDISAALAVLDGMKPENEVEAMLLAQMWATNESAMRALAMVGKSDWIDHSAMFGNFAVKLLRTYAIQVEALAKLRRKGEQTVKVVHVYPGGQAVVADTISAGGGELGKTPEQSHATGAAGDSPALLGSDPFGSGVPISGSERAEAVPTPRWDKPRRSEG